MDSLYLLIPVALAFCLLAIKLLLWAIDNGQYDDLDKEAWRILADEDAAPPTSDSVADRAGPVELTAPPREPPADGPRDGPREDGSA